ncbi:XkdX family protein [Bacillus paralicheniformis]|uniref:XkdX family protein n=1 Tax=Bacillus subtilis group TaxID=653685 RepID=UPI00189CDB13|nr:MULTISPECIES: XkdX family protein [Bacillus subtilis group]MED1151235.1 XkdX family protein [Bacillus paralicheniformis]MED4341969.1 XkdX family protein [Bacillus licheniformis]
MMYPDFAAIKQFYDWGCYDDDSIMRDYVDWGHITPAEYEKITGRSYDKLAVCVDLGMPNAQ